MIATHTPPIDDPHHRFKSPVWRSPTREPFPEQVRFRVSLHSVTRHHPWHPRLLHQTSGVSLPPRIACVAHLQCSVAFRRRSTATSDNATRSSSSSSRRVPRDLCSATATGGVVNKSVGDSGHSAASPAAYSARPFAALPQTELAPLSRSTGLRSSSSSGSSPEPGSPTTLEEAHLLWSQGYSVPIIGSAQRPGWRRRGAEEGRFMVPHHL